LKKKTENLPRLVVRNTCFLCKDDEKNLYDLEQKNDRKNLYDLEQKNDRKNLYDLEQKNDRKKFLEKLNDSDSRYLNTYALSFIGNVTSIIQWPFARLLECWALLIISLNLYAIRDENLEIVESSFAGKIITSYLTLMETSHKRPVYAPSSKVHAPGLLERPVRILFLRFVFDFFTFCFFLLQNLIIFRSQILVEQLGGNVFFYKNL
jgi:hypothetical protein